MKKITLLTFAGLVVTFFLPHLNTHAGVPGDEHWDSQFGPAGLNANTYGVAVVGNKVFASGYFTAAGGVKTPGVAGFDGTNWFPLNGGLPITGGGSPTVIWLSTDNNYLYAGGLFNSGDDPTAINTARWDGTNWAGIGIKGLLAKVKRNGSNVYFGGSFSGTATVNSTNIIGWDGTNWFALGAGLGGTGYGISGGVLAIAFQGNNIYAGGSFSYSGTMAMTNVAYWDGTLWHAMGNPFNGSVSALQFYSGYLYACGSFTNTTLQFTNIARWNGSTWSGLPGGGANKAVADLATDGTNLFICGSFTTIGGIAATNIVSFDGNNWTPLNSGLHWFQDGLGLPQAFKLCWASNQLYVVGGFDRADKSGAACIARWDGTNWWSLGGDTSKGLGEGALDAAQGVFLLPNAVNSGAVPPGLYVGGLFPVAGKTNANCVAYFDGSNWSPLGAGVSGQFGSTPRVYSFATDGTYLYAGGNFTNAGAYTGVGGIAQWDGYNWYPLWSGLDWMVNALAVDGYGYLWVGGSFTNVAYTSGSAKGLDVWYGGSWYNFGDVDGTNAIIYAIAYDGGTRIYVGGQFYSVGGVSATNIAYWDWNDGWHALGLGVNSKVSSLAYGNGILYAGGTFTKAGGLTANRIAQWDGSSWSTLSSGVTGPSTATGINGIAVSGNYVYVTGNFTNAGGIIASNVAAWNGSTWSAMGSGLASSTSATGYSIAAANDDVYIVGRFDFAGDKPAQSISHWNSQSNYYPEANIVLTRSAMQTNRLFQFRVNGTYGQSYIILASTNLSTWTPLQTNGATFYDFSDAKSTNYPNRCYRVRLGP